MSEGGTNVDYTLIVADLYEKYAKDVLRVSYFYLGNREQAEDVTQEVYIRLLETQPVLKAGAEKSWLLKVALNRCRDLWRSSWAKRVLLGTPILEMIPSDDEIEKRTEKQALMQAVHALPAATRDVIILFYYQNYGIEEISGILNEPPGTISSRLSRGRAKLKEILEREA